ncbi:MAG: T6SS immunity protein Tdi1 domain-containing protein [Bacteroidota bacterium]
MTLTLKELTKDIDKVDVDDILSCWHWLIADMKAVVTISVLGDIFLLGNDGVIYWLQTDSGELTKAANSLQEYQNYLYDDDQIDNWFLPLLVEKLIAAGKSLKENEVYSYKKIPVIGGEYSVDNMEPTDMSVHFAFCGQICEQIKDLPDGTRVSVKFEK